MMGSFLTRTFILALGYAYPAYECFKTVEKNKPEIEQLRFWCQYWILVAVLGVLERVGDAFISWLPMYSEAKLALFIYLWYPKTRGTVYVYQTFLRPYVAKHEMEIDRNLLELRARTGDMLVLYSQKAASYGQKRFFEILQYIASQSTAPRRRPAQRREQQQVNPSSTTATTRQPPGAALQPSVPSLKLPVKSKAHGPKEGGGHQLVHSQKPGSPSQPCSETNRPSSERGDGTRNEQMKTSTREGAKLPNNQQTCTR